MPNTDKRVDAYIAKAGSFAQPILREIRAIVHEGCPEVEETIKWGMPFFLHNGMLCHMAAFKEHCAFGFLKGRLVPDEKVSKTAGAMGQFGRITSMRDLPPKKVLVDYVTKAANAGGVKGPSSKAKNKKKELLIPDYFAAAVRRNKKAHATFEAFPYSKRKDYVEWVSGAKTQETRERRLKTSVAWLAEGKSRNWKYEKC